MSTHSISSREFTGRVAKAKRWAADGPAFITDRGEPAHVLLTIDEYLHLTGGGKNLVEQLALPEADEMDLDIEPIGIGARDLEA